MDSEGDAPSSQLHPLFRIPSCILFKRANFGKGTTKKFLPSAFMGSKYMYAKTAFAAGLCPRPCCENLQHSQDPWLDLRGMGREGDGKKGEIMWK